MKELNDTNQIFEALVKRCGELLLENKKAVKYLTDRKISEKSIKEFQIGLFPKDLRKLFTSVEPKLLKDVGVIFNADTSLFKTRDIILPVKDVYGNYLGIAGRTRLTEEERAELGIAKYHNSVYSKSQHLFGLNLAKKHIIKKNKVYLVEGYYDMITPYQNGIKNVVATCSLSISTRQLILISRYTNNIIVLFDNEEGGQNRANEMVIRGRKLGVDITAKNPFPDDVKDLDEFFRNYAVEEVVEALEKS